MKTCGFFFPISSIFSTKQMVTYEGHMLRHRLVKRGRLCLWKSFSRWIRLWPSFRATHSILNGTFWSLPLSVRSGGLPPQNSKHFSSMQHGCQKATILGESTWLVELQHTWNWWYRIDSSCYFWLIRSSDTVFVVVLIRLASPLDLHPDESGHWCAWDTQMPNWRRKAGSAAVS